MLNLQTMKLKLHKIIGASVKLFLDSLGYKSVWNKIDSNFDELLILPTHNKLLKAIVAEIQKTGYIPYHFALNFDSRGTLIEGETLESGIKKIKFIGEVKEVKTFENISGDFHLIRYEDVDGNNFINKRYKMNNEIVYGSVIVDCRPVAQLIGLKGENVNLINWARVKVYEGT